MDNILRGIALLSLLVSIGCGRSEPVVEPPATPVVAVEETTSNLPKLSPAETQALVEMLNSLGAVAEACDQYGQWDSLKAHQIKVGTVGQLTESTTARITQIVGPDTMLANFGGRVVLLQGIDTANHVDGETIELGNRVVHVPKTIRYETVTGGTNQVFAVRVIAEREVDTIRQERRNETAKKANPAYTPEQSSN